MYSMSTLSGPPVFQTQSEDEAWLAGDSFCSCYLLLLTKGNSCKEMLFLCLQPQQHHDWLGLSKTLRMKWEFSFNFPLCFLRGYSRYCNSKAVSLERPVFKEWKCTNVVYKGINWKAVRARKRFLTHKGVQAEDACSHKPSHTQIKDFALQHGQTGSNSCLI